MKRMIKRMLIVMMMTQITVEAFAFEDIDHQLSITNESPGQIWQLIGVVGTFIGIGAIIFLLHCWRRYRNERDRHYWNGGYHTLPQDFIENGSIDTLTTGRCGGGVGAMDNQRDFHQTVAAFLPPGKGERKKRT